MILVVGGGDMVGAGLINDGDGANVAFFTFPVGATLAEGESDALGKAAVTLLALLLGLELDEGKAVVRLLPMLLGLELDEGGEDKVALLLGLELDEGEDDMVGKTEVTLAVGLELDEGGDDTDGETEVTLAVGLELDEGTLVPLPALLGLELGENENEGTKEGILDGSELGTVVSPAVEGDDVGM